MEKLVALHRNQFGDIISFVTSQGRVISYRKALMEAENGLIEGVHAQTDYEGNVYLSPGPGESFDQYPDIY